MIERERMPGDRSGITKALRIEGAEPCYLTVNFLPDGRVGELFLDGKMGEMELAFADATCMAISIGLQAGIPLRVFIEKLKGLRANPYGFTRDSKFPVVSSLLDYIARFLESLTNAESAT